MRLKVTIGKYDLDMSGSREDLILSVKRLIPLLAEDTISDVVDSSADDDAKVRLLSPQQWSVIRND